MSAPIKRGTARRLGLRRPLRPGEYYAPLPRGWVYDETHLWPQDWENLPTLRKSPTGRGWFLETSTVDQEVIEP